MIKLTDFGHLGIFAEQRANWLKLAGITAKTGSAREFRILNLFGYTGGSTLATAAAGAHVTHVDASKTSNAWARDNAEIRGLADKPIRWLTEDVKKFIDREIRRGSCYHGIILDPPSYGRGNKNEVWKIETDLPPLLEKLASLLADDFAFVLLSAHSNGYTPLALENLVQDMVREARGHYEAAEMVIEEVGTGRKLPSGASCLFERG